MIVFAVLVVLVGFSCCWWCLESGYRVPRWALIVAAMFFGLGLPATLWRLAGDPFNWWYIVTAVGAVYGFVDVLRRARAWRLARYGDSVAARLDIW